MGWGPPSPPGPLSLGRGGVSNALPGEAFQDSEKATSNEKRLKSLSLREGLPRLSGKRFRVRAQS